VMPRLILMTDRVRLPEPEEAIRQLPRDSAVIVREVTAAARASLARRVQPICRGRHIRLLIAGDWQLAHAIGADGLHLPEATIRHGPQRWRCVRKPSWLVTAAAHERSTIVRAAASGVDAVLLSPVYSTLSHTNAPPLGVLRFASWARRSSIAVYALGGIDGAGARRLLPSGAAGFAAISGLTPMVHPPDPSSA
jgi:thiamine-phosphate pyrophosphorylase